MSLKNKFLLGSLAAVLLVFAMLLVGMGVRLQHYFQAQLSSHAQDTATSLAVAINSALRQQDTALLEATVQAVFDSGYYSRINVQDTSGKKIVEKVQPYTNGDIPTWLPNMIKLEAPLRSAFISSGWKQAGKIEVSSQPAFAYRELWQLLQDAAIWLTAAIIFTMLLMTAVVRSILRPLLKIEHASLAISRREFVEIAPIPHTRELKQLVQAFNTLTSSVRLMLNEAESLAEHLRKQTLSDALTETGNRRSLNANIEMLLESPQGEYALALLQIGGLRELNITGGHEQGDKFVLALSGVIKSSTPLLFLARVHGSTFALLLPFTSERELAEKLEATRLQLENICHIFGLNDEFNCSVAAIQLSDKQTSSTALAKVDEALARSHNLGHTVIDCTKNTGLDSSWWQKFLQTAILEKRFLLYKQSVISYTDLHIQGHSSVLHFEIYSRLLDSDGQLLKAARFMPMAVRHKLAADIDRLCLSKLIQHMKATHSRGTTYAFNICYELLCDPAFPAWLSNELNSFGVASSDLILEVAESILRTSPQQAKVFSDSLNSHGLSFGIDQFGLRKGTISELAKLQPVYFKLITDLTRHCTDIEEYGEYIAWLVKTAKMLNIPVIATCVQNEEWQACLFKVGVSGFQGQLIGPVASLENPDDIEPDLS